MPRLVIKSHRPWQWTIGIIALSMAATVVTVLLLDNSYWRILSSSISESNTTQALVDTNRELEVQNRELRNKILMLEQTASVDKETAVMLQGEMVNLQDQIYQLKQELEFYQGVMDSARKTVGMDVHGLYVEPLSGTNRYLLKLVLTRVSNNDSVAKGILNIDLEGTQNGEKRRLYMAGLSVDEKAAFAFEIKSFKRLDYAFELTDGFAPDKFVVHIESKTGGETPVNKTYAWPL